MAFNEECKSWDNYVTRHVTVILLLLQLRRHEEQKEQQGGGSLMGPTTQTPET